MAKEDSSWPEYSTRLNIICPVFSAVFSHFVVTVVVWGFFEKEREKGREAIEGKGEAESQVGSMPSIEPIAGLSPMALRS